MLPSAYPPETLTISIVTRHFGDCAFKNKPLRKQCKCRKPSYICEAGPKRTFSAAMQSWEQVEMAAHAERDKLKPVQAARAGFLEVCLTLRGNGDSSAAHSHSSPHPATLSRHVAGIAIWEYCACQALDDSRAHFVAIVPYGSDCLQQSLPVFLLQSLRRRLHRPPGQGRSPSRRS